MSRERRRNGDESEREKVRRNVNVTLRHRCGKERRERVKDFEGCERQRQT